MECGSISGGHSRKFLILHLQDSRRNAHGSGATRRQIYKPSVALWIERFPNQSSTTTSTSDGPA
jgi:hypothetical protein